MTRSCGTRGRDEDQDSEIIEGISTVTPDHATSDNQDSMPAEELQLRVSVAEEPLAEISPELYALSSRILWVMK